MSEFLTALYIVGNSFLAGIYYRDNIEGCNDAYQRFGCVLISFVIVLAGIPLIGVGLIYEAFKWVYVTFQIKFFVQYMLTKKWHDVEKSRLETINRVSARKKGKGISDSIYRYCTELINKRNGFKFNP